MKKGHLVGSWFRRVLAAVLAVSMIVIPVNFSGIASAAASKIGQEITSPNYFADDFSSGQYLDGVKYKWNVHSSVYDTGITEAGIYATYLVENSHSLLKLNAKNASGGDASANWSNYTFEADIRRDNASTTSDNIFLLGRMSSKGHYAMVFGGTNFTVWKIDSTGYKTRLKDCGSGIGGRDFSDWVHVKMTFRGSKITIILTGNRADGTPVETVHEFEDSTYTKGGVAFWACRDTTLNDNWTAYYKNPKVTLADGTVAYSGAIEMGKTKTINGITYSWEESFTNKNNYSMGGSQFMISSGPKDGEVDANGKAGSYRNYVTLAAESYDNVLKKTVDLSQEWENYTVEATVSRFNDAGNPPAGIVGRLRWDDKNRPTYYAFVVKGDRLMLLKTYYEPGGTLKEDYGLLAARNIGVESEDNRLRDCLGRGRAIRLKMEFVDNVIRCYYNDDLFIEYVDDGTFGAPLMNGTVGMYMQGRGWYAYFDNFLFTPSGDTTSFLDTFSDDRYFKGMNYQLETTEEPEQLDVTYNWTTANPLKFADGAFRVDTAKNMNNWSFLNGVAKNGTDVDQTWTNYTVEVDFRRDGGQDLGKQDRMLLAGRVNEQGYYAVQFNGELDFCWYDNQGNGVRLLNKSSGVPVNYSGWVHLFMTFKDDTITYGLTATLDDGTTVETVYTVPEKNMQGVPRFISGGIGFGIIRSNVTADWAAYCKNFKITLEDGTVVYTDPFEAATPEPAESVMYSWQDKSQGSAKFEVSDGACKYVTSLSKDDAVAYLKGVLDDGTSVIEGWTDYKIEADIRREKSNEPDCVYILGRVNGDDTYYGLGYNGDNLYLMRFDGAHDDTAMKCRLANVGTGLARSYDGTVHLWLTFEGKVIRYGISYVKADGTGYTNEWSYTETGVCPEKNHQETPLENCGTYYAAGGVGIRIEGSYNDKDGDGTWIGYIDNLKVTLADGTVAYYDPFNTVPDSVRQDATYTWNQAIPTGNVAGPDDGVYKSTVKANTKNYAVLKGVAQDNSNATAGWKDYVVEADVTRVGAVSGNDSFYLLGRVGANGGYGFRFSGSTVALCKVDANGKAAVIKEEASKTGGVTFGEEVHMKMTMAGKHITITLTGKDSNHNSVVTEYTFTDSTFTAGSIGMLTEGSAAWSVTVDNIKVTLGSGIVAYADTVSSPPAQLNTYKWNENLGVFRTYSASSQIVGGVYSIVSETDRTGSYVVLGGGESWDDYQVGTLIRRQCEAGGCSIGLLARANPVYKNGELVGHTYYSACLGANNANNVVISKDVWNAEKGQIETINIAKFTNESKLLNNVWRYMELEVEGATISLRVYSYDEATKATALLKEYTATDSGALTDSSSNVTPVYYTGTSGMYVLATTGDKAVSADYKDIFVQTADGEVAFAENFSDSVDFFAGAEYAPAVPEGGYDNGFDADGLTVENGYVPESAGNEYVNGFNVTGMLMQGAYVPPLVTKDANNAFYPEGRVVEKAYTVPLVCNWSVVNGSLYKTGTDDYPQVLNVHDGIANYAQDWKNYSVEADIMLTGAASRGGILFAVNNLSFYEFRLDGDKAYLLNSASNTPLAEKTLSLSVNVWHFVKIEMAGTKVSCYVDGSLVISYTLSKSTSGTVGLRAVSNVRYDNMAVYPNSESDLRKFRSYQFDAANAAELDSVWSFDDVSKWNVLDRLLSYTGSNMGTVQLRTKELLKNYFVEVNVTPKSQTAVMGVMGRVNGTKGYSMTVDMAKGLTLYRNGTKMGAVSKDALYLKGIMLLPGAEYALRLEMYDGDINCFINGVRLLQVKDSNPLPAGSLGITQSKNVDVRMLTTGKSKHLELSFVDFDGKTHKSFTVNPGKVPDIKNMYLKVDDGNGTPLLVLLDTVMDDSQFDENATGTVTIPVEYEGAVINFTYKVVERPDYIKKLNKDIEALNLETVTEEQYDELYDRFNDLSFKEKPGITEANQQKLKDARHKVLTTLHPMLADYEVVYEQTFDTRDTINEFRYGKMDTGSDMPGNWYVENGVLHQYFEDDSLRAASSWGECITKDRSFEVRYISADFKIYDGLTWAGISLFNNDEDNNRLLFYVSDKYDGYGGNRIRLVKNHNWHVAGTILQKELEEEEMYVLEPDTWYNLKMIITEDHVIRCYLNGQLFIEWQDYATPGYPDVYDTGSVGFGSFEGYHAFDNLVVYGKEVEHDPYKKVNTDLEEKYWGDDFQDEKDNKGKSPSHWIEDPRTDKWQVKTSGNNVFYGSKDNLESSSQTWLHVLESEIDYSAQLRITAQGNYPTLGLTARVSTRDSFIHAGYDMYLKKWFVQYQKGANWEVKTIYDDEVDNNVDFSNWVTIRVKIVDDTLELYKGNQLMMTADVSERPGVGRVGIFTERCNVDIDNVKLHQLSGQGTVLDGVLEYYLSDQGFVSQQYTVLEMPNGDIILNQDYGVSKDGGATFYRSDEYKGMKMGSTTRLRSGNYVTVVNSMVKQEDGTKDALIEAYRGVVGADGTITWIKGGTLEVEPEHSYGQPLGHINEVVLADGTHRLFITFGAGHGEVMYLDSEDVTVNQTYYSDDEGMTWKMNEIPTEDVIGQPLFTESHVIYISQDTYDISGNFIPKGTLVHYSNYCTRNRMSYTLSFDGGKTWEGDYAIPYMITPRGSFAIAEDLYNEGTFYMTMFYGPANKRASGNSRYHIVLARSYDGLNWHYLGDVDRWDIDSGSDLRGMFHATNAYVNITEDYVFPGFGRNEIWAPSYKTLRPVIHRFEKSKLVDMPWPEEYVINDKDIVYIEIQPTRTVFPKFSAFAYEGSKILVHYYDQSTELLDMEELYEKGVIKIEEPKMQEEGKERVKVTYDGFAAVYEVTVTSGHQGGTATCTDRAICDLCGQPYGRTTDHEVSFVKGFAETETVNGMHDHYACVHCHSTFSDAEGKRKFDAVIPAWVSVQDGEATIQDIIVENAIDKAEDQIVMNFDYADLFVQDVIFTGEAFKKAAAEGKPVIIVTSELTITLDATAVAAIADAVNKKNDVTISVKFVENDELNESQSSALSGSNVKYILSAQITSRGKEIGDFGGGAVTIRIPVGDKANEHELWYVDDDGNIEKVHVTYEGEDMVVELYHFSMYAVVYTGANIGLIVLIVAVALLAAAAAVVFLVPPVRSKVLGIFKKKKALPEPEAEEAEITNE